MTDGDPTHVVVRHGGRELNGVARATESWAAAARRIAATVPGDPVAEDLSGEVKRFVVDPDLAVALRPMGRGDLPDVVRWRCAEHVSTWFHDSEPATLDSVTERYGPRIDGIAATRMWVIEVNGRSVGLVQDYRLADHPDFVVPVADPDAVGVDYLVGEPTWVGRGIATRALWAWLGRTTRRYPDLAVCFAAPDHRNAASLRVLEKVGFTQGTWFDEPQADGPPATLIGCTLDVRRVFG